MPLWLPPFLPRVFSGLSSAKRPRPPCDTIRHFSWMLGPGLHSAERRPGLHGKRARCAMPASCSGERALQRNCHTFSQCAGREHSGRRFAHRTTGRGHHFIFVVEPGRRPVNGADESSRAAAEHPQPQSPAHRGFFCSRNHAISGLLARGRASGAARLGRFERRRNHRTIARLLE
jgi:hypothetical protein